ncbi:MAG: hypothetical protein ACRDMZ_22050 [Solirubrobacteraceae bacterium]
MKDAKNRKPETRAIAPRAITLLDVLQVVRSVAETDAEAAATLEHMLRSGTVRFLSEDALAA